MNIILNLLLTTNLDYDYLNEDPRDFTFLEQDMAGEGVFYFKLFYFSLIIRNQII